MLSRPEPDRGQPALLEIRDLMVCFGSGTAAVHAVRGVSLTLGPGEILGIVGESGCGKSVTARAALKLIEPPGRITSGSVLFGGRDLFCVSAEELREVRGNHISMIFQDPTKSLNPVLTVGQQIGAVIGAHRRLSRDEGRRRACELLADVGIPDPERRVAQYPHEFSGGMRQRVMIAMALANQPSVIIADEPTTALDVTIQAQILDLLRRINRDRDTSLIFISHNLGVVAELCHRVAVFYAGRVVESGTTADVFSNPQHPYTRALLGSLPEPGTGGQRLTPVAGSPPVMTKPPQGCAFAPRCPLRMDRCGDDPRLVTVLPAHDAACWVAQAAAPASTASA
jgi:oligopeptide/dipeptide ABC transporter ATP-binding protein